MSNPGRLEVLILVAEGEKRVGELAEAVGLSQSALSQHLSRLRRAGLVRTRREGQSIHYRCASDAVVTVLAALAGIFNASVNAQQKGGDKECRP